MPRVVHFEIHADDPERAVGFYRAVFGGDIQKWAGPIDYWLITTGPEGEPGINGAILQRRHSVGDDVAVIAYVCTIEVPALDDYIARVNEAGGQVALPKTPVPGVGWMAHYKDTEGNIFGMMQPDPKAG